MTETVMIWVHTELIDRHTGATGVFAGEERGTIWSTHGTTGDSVAEIRTLCGKIIYIRGACADIARITTRLVAELIGENIDEVRLLCC